MECPGGAFLASSHIMSPFRPHLLPFSLVWAYKMPLNKSPDLFPKSCKLSAPRLDLAHINMFCLAYPCSVGYVVFVFAFYST